MAFSPAAPRLDGAVAASPLLVVSLPLRFAHCTCKSDVTFYSLQPCGSCASMHCTSQVPALRIFLFPMFSVLFKSALECDYVAMLEDYGAQVNPETLARNLRSRYQSHTNINDLA